LEGYSLHLLSFSQKSWLEPAKKEGNLFKGKLVGFSFNIFSFDPSKSKGKARIGYVNVGHSLDSILPNLSKSSFKQATFVGNVNDAPRLDMNQNFSNTLKTILDIKFFCYLLYNHIKLSIHLKRVLG